MLLSLGLVLASYLLGSLSSAVLICRVIGAPDPRESGSGNPGATNVLRSAGKAAAAATLLSDIAKGVVPVLLAKHFDLAPWVVGGCACAAFLGHLFPVFFGFRGGKGVATFTGVLFALAPLMGAAFCGIWLTAAAIFRYSSLAALLATAAAPLVGLALGLPGAITGALVIMASAIFWRHRANIGRLIAGTESRIGKPKV